MDEQTNPTPAPSEMPKKESGGPGATLAIIVILLLIVAGGWYYFTNVGSLTGEPATVDDGSADVAALEAQGTSDNVADIEADVNATDLSGLDSAAAGFGAELEAQ